MSTPTFGVDPEVLAAALDAADRLELGGVQPELGAGNLLVLSGEPPPDGVAERAVIDSARCVSHDSGGLWFAERARVRRFSLAERHVMTLDLA